MFFLCIYLFLLNFNVIYFELKFNEFEQKM